MTPTCDYCTRSFTDPRGCEYLDADERPVVYGAELHPASESEVCRDCGAPKGTYHHVECLCTECPGCHRQWHPGLTCEADAELTAGAAA